MKKALCILCAGALVVALVGCGSQSSQSSSASSSFAASSAAAPAASGSSAPDAQKANLKTGRITAISGTSVTVELGTLDGMQGGGPGGQAPDGKSGQPAGSGSAPSGSAPSQPQSGSSTTPPAAPESGAASGSASQGEAPTPTFTPTGESATLDLSNAAITRQDGANSTTLSLSDLAVGDLLSYEEGNAAKAVTVMSTAQ